MARTIDELPGPAGLPLLGNALQLARASRLHTVCERWADRYGPILRVEIGRRLVVGISDGDAVNMILRERPEGFRRWSEQQVVFDEMGLSGVFTAEGEQWKRQRRLVITALNTNHLHRYYGVIRTSAERLHRRLSDAALAGRVLEIGQELTSYSLDVTSALAFGHDLNTLERREGELQEHIQRAFGMLVRRIAAPSRIGGGSSCPPIVRGSVAGRLHRARSSSSSRPGSDRRSGRSCARRRRTSWRA